MAKSTGMTPSAISHQSRNTRPSPVMRGRRRQPERPVAARAEEAELAGAVGDVGVVAVLRTRVDAAGDEPEVAAAHRAAAGRRTGPARWCRPTRPAARRPRSRRRRRRRTRTGSRDGSRRAVYSVFIRLPRFRAGLSRSGRTACAVSVGLERMRRRRARLPRRSRSAPAWRSESPLPLGAREVAGRTSPSSTARISKFIMRVVGAAQLGAAPDVRALGRRPVIWNSLFGSLPGKTSRLNSMLRHPERVDDVVGSVSLEPDRLVGRQHQDRDLVAACRPCRRPCWPPRRGRRVDELPVPLEARPTSTVTSGFADGLLT